MANKPTSELEEIAREKIVRVTVDEDLAGPPMEAGFVTSELVEPRAITVTYNCSLSGAGQVLTLIQQHGYAIESVTTREPDSKGVFVHLSSATAR